MQKRSLVFHQCCWAARQEMHRSFRSSCRLGLLDASVLASYTPAPVNGVVFSLQHYQCVVPLDANSLQSGRARSTASCGSLGHSAPSSTRTIVVAPAVSAWMVRYSLYLVRRRLKMVPCLLHQCRVKWPRGDAGADQSGLRGWERTLLNAWTGYSCEWHPVTCPQLISHSFYTCQQTIRPITTAINITN